MPCHSTLQQIIECDWILTLWTNCESSISQYSGQRCLAVMAKNKCAFCGCLKNEFKTHNPFGTIWLDLRSVEILFKHYYINADNLQYTRSLYLAPAQNPSSKGKIASNSAIIMHNCNLKKWIVYPFIREDFKTGAHAARVFGSAERERSPPSNPLFYFLERFSQIVILHQINKTCVIP